MTKAPSKPHRRDAHSEEGMPGADVRTPVCEAKYARNGRTAYGNKGLPETFQ